MSVKLVAVEGCATGGGLAPPAVARLLTDIAKLESNLVSWLS